MKDLTARWQMMGIVGELRELKSPKNKDWRGYVVKLQTLGSTFEVQAEEDQYKKIKEGEAYALQGIFEDQGGRLRLILKEFKPAA